MGKQIVNPYPSQPPEFDRTPIVQVSLSRSFLADIQRNLPRNGLHTSSAPVNTSQIVGGRTIGISKTRPDNR